MITVWMNTNIRAFSINRVVRISDQISLDIERIDWIGLDTHTHTHTHTHTILIVH